MSQLEEALALALKLEPKERLQLIEKLVVSVEAELEFSLPPEEEKHWGKRLKQIIDRIGVVELDYPEIEDSVEWVKHIRKVQDKKRLGDWGEEE